MKLLLSSARRVTVGKKRLPLVGISMGDPAGIGPEICLQAMAAPAVLKACCPVLFGDAEVLEVIARKIGLPMPIRKISLAEWRAGKTVDVPAVVDCEAVRSKDIRPGRVLKICGRASYEYIRAALESAQTGRVAAIATAPINKESLNRAGLPYPGHTEILATLTKTRRFCMMLASDEITVSLVTTHVGYRTAAGLISTSRILDVIELTAGAMKKLGRPKPAITVCSLNPHGGEHGLFGDEEARIIIPAIQAARRKGYNVIGPVPPDTAFLPEKRAITDAYVVMYHDQGLIPFKMLAFDKGVNITLGLPVVRTSADHGTAHDIAWQGRASAGSMIQSILWAVRLASSPA